MHYEIYIENLLLPEFTFHFAALFILKKNLNRTAGLVRLILSAAFGMMGSLLLFFSPWGGILMLLMILLEVFIAYGKSSIGFLFKASSRLLLLCFLFGGVLYYLKGKVRLKNSSKVGEYFLNTTCGLVILGIIFGTIGYGLVQRKSEKSRTCKVLLKTKEGKDIWLRGMVDTGNQLYEPISKKPVCIIGKEYFTKLIGEGAPMRVIPYTSVGCKRDLLQGYLTDYMKILTGDEEIEAGDFYLGICEQNILAGRDFTILLHPAVLEKGNRR